MTSADPEAETYGSGLRPGSAHYRAYVGPPDQYDLVAGLQFTLLFRAGLRDKSKLLDLGCGSLRGGRLFIPYLRSGNYFGVEPNEWLVQEGIERELGADIIRVKQPTFSNISDFGLTALGQRFDFVLAQSVFSHTFSEMTLQGLAGVRDCLADEGVLVGTYLESDRTPEEGSGWLYPACVPYTWEAFSDVGTHAGLELRRIDWPHPRQSWFVAALDARTADASAARIQSAEIDY